MQTILQVQGLTKRYGEKTVVRGIDFSIAEGEILCILGPNGAGKSTTINILTGVLRHDAGTVQSYGVDIHKRLSQYQRSIGVVPQELALYDDLTAEKNVRFFASLYGLRGAQLREQCNWALALAGLTERAGEKVHTFSGGMKRRLNIACAMVHSPKLLIMDEPTVGIDPQSRNYILESIQRLRDAGMTILYTTHYMEEVEEISTRIIIMDNGSIIAEGTKEDIKAHAEDERKYIIAGNYKDTLDTEPFYHIDGVKAVSASPQSIEIRTLKGVENLDRLIGCLLAQSVKINDISCQSASLETVFLSLTGKSLRD